MAVIRVKDKYYLRSLHEEISLCDRKIAHLAKYGNFTSGMDREQTELTINQKRDLLVRDARQLVEAGIEYHPSELPHSLRVVEPVPTTEPV